MGRWGCSRTCRLRPLPSTPFTNRRRSPSSVAARSRKSHRRGQPGSCPSRPAACRSCRHPRSLRMWRHPGRRCTRSRLSPWQPWTPFRCRRRGRLCARSRPVPWQMSTQLHCRHRRRLRQEQIFALADVDSIPLPPPPPSIAEQQERQRAHSAAQPRANGVKQGGTVEHNLHCTFKAPARELTSAAIAPEQHRWAGAHLSLLTCRGI